MKDANDKKINYKLYSFFGIFLLLYLVFLVTHYTKNLSLFFDIPAMFFIAIWDYDDPNKHYYMYHSYDNVRLFSNFLLVLPFNIFGIPFVKSILSLSSFFSFSYLIMHFVALFINFLVAKRTKRYDIAIFAFAFYVICSLPNIIWSVREVHFTILFYFAILSYFLSETELSKKDLLPISLMLLYLFESFEITFVFGWIMFIFMHLYAKKQNVKNVWYKILIGVGSFCAALYIPFKILYLMFYRNLVFTEGQGPQEWINGSINTLEVMFESDLIIFIFALIAVLITIFYKREYDKWSVLFFVPFISILLFVLYKQTGLYPNAHSEICNYSVAFWFIFPVILAILCCDYYEIKLKQYFVNNILLVACIFGSLNLLWQIYSNIEFGKYVNFMKETIRKSETTIVQVPEEKYQNLKYVRSYNTCFSTIPASIILSETKKVEKFVMPSKYYIDYNQWCFYDLENTHYNSKYDILKLQTAYVLPQTSLLDLTPIVDEFKKQGLVKD